MNPQVEAPANRAISPARPANGAAESSVVLRTEHLRVETVTGGAIIGDIGFTLGRGEILGVVGESGSGKTTTTLALLGMAHPGAKLAGGHVDANGRHIDVTDAKKIATLRGRYLSYVPQSPGTALNPVMRVRVALRELLRNCPDSRRPPKGEWDSRIDDVLVKVGLPNTRDFLRRFPHQLSGGQQQRVCIAMSLLSGADVLILDEPTTGLDVITQASVLEELQRLRTELGLSMLYISHDLAVVSQVADRVLVMYRGEIVESGPTHAILHTPEHEYTKRLLAASLDHREPVAPEMVVEPRVAATPTGPGRVTAPTDGADPAGNAALLVHDLTVEHLSGGRVVASVNEVSFRIDAGTCVALLGSSGSGKSTIGRAVVGLKPRKAGTICLDGTDLAPDVGRRTDQQRRRLQIVFQNSSAALNPRENVGTAIKRGQAHLSVDELARGGSTDHLLDLVRLPTAFKHRMPRELSGGERQRVCIARALGAAPSVIVCDEITSALDVSVQASVLKLLKELQRDLGLSLLFITHDMGVVSYIADSVVVLEHGRVCEAGETDAVLNRPESDYVRSLMAAVPSLHQP